MNMEPNTSSTNAFFATIPHEKTSLVLTPSQALMAISVLAVMVDKDLSEPDKQTLFSHLIRLFSSYSSEEFKSLFQGVFSLLKKYSTSEVFTAAKKTLTPSLRQTAFAIATDLVLADGWMSPGERNLLFQLWHSLEIPDHIGEKILEVMLIKNCWDQEENHA